MKRFPVFCALASLACSNLAIAGSQSGTIASWIAHAYTTDRGPCVQLSPALPGTGWACLYRTGNNNYKEQLAALLAARLSGSAVSIWWDAEDADGHKIIAQLQL